MTLRVVLNRHTRDTTNLKLQQSAKRVDACERGRESRLKRQVEVLAIQWELGIIYSCMDWSGTERRLSHGK
jgi:hypothetical protein